MGFGQRIKPAVDAELQAAQRLLGAGEAARAFRHLERAHVLGQGSTVQHVRVHGQMLRWALRHRDWAELRAQVLRIVGAATKTAIGLVPAGNTGGGKISPFQRLPIPDDLQALLRCAGKPFPDRGRAQPGSSDAT